MQKILTVLVITTIMSSCFNTIIKSSGKVSVLDYTPRVSLAKSVTEAKSISSFDPDSMVETMIQAPSGALAGSTVMMPPGALAIAADLVIEESVPLSETSVATSLNLREDLEVKPIGAGLIIRPTSNVDLTRPLTIAMSLGSETGLWAWFKKRAFLQTEKNYAVFYKSMIHGELKDGVIPGNSLRMTDDNKVEFEGYFGAFWLCEMNFPIEERVETNTLETVVNIDRVSVIEVAGIVTEEDIVVKATIPEVTWSPVIFTFDLDSRTVNLKAKIGPDRSLVSCQVDLRSAVDASSGSNADASPDLNYTVQIKKKEAHSLVGRFRCVDDMNRQASSEWSALLQIPIELDRIAPEAPASVTFDRALYPGSRAKVSFAASRDEDLDFYRAKVCRQADCQNQCEGEQTLKTLVAEFNLQEAQAVYACVQAVDKTGNASAWTVSRQTALSDSQAPLIDLGGARRAGTSFTLRPSVTDASPLSYAWTQVSGPGSIQFESATAKDTLIAADQEGVYQLKLTVSDATGHSSSAQVQLSW
ncbi:MAG: hypothetical protein NTX25_10980, partial [Proteobacteria bacterium]|nr:hypothetical protein [Pseudomonadota bacterium]